MGRSGSGVKPASESSIQISFSFNGVECRERIPLKPTPANLEAARRHRDAILYAIKNGTFDYSVTFPNSKMAARFAARPGSTEHLQAYLQRWLERQKPLIKNSTYIGYRKIILNTITPQFGTLKLQDLSRSMLRDWCDGMSNVSNKRIANVLSPLRAALQDAVYDELIDSNPLYGWNYRRKEAPKSNDDVDPFTTTEQADILAALQGTARNQIQFAFWTGLRTSELVALEWGDIDWRRGMARISRAITQGSEEPEVTKTKAGTRDLKLLAPALAALNDQKQYSYLHPSGRVFLDPRKNQPWEGDAAIRKSLWTPALRRAKVRYRRPYQTRHTYASMMLSAGEHPMWVAQQMGHSDWTMIARVYGKWIPDANPDAGGKAVALFNTAGNQNVA
ncbi:site-specific integrase [Chitinibacter tainanensis]|uniref:tyrosine-type recombinase/integrase n=1 Tax=Chitinibacter tainanensis TaxID=230667 RepID=UPI00235566EA|nr:site-specific integrase [Chitinibacter tainanensis]